MAILGPCFCTAQPERGALLTQGTGSSLQLHRYHPFIFPNTETKYHVPCMNKRASLFSCCQKLCCLGFWIVFLHRPLSNMIKIKHIPRESLVISRKVRESIFVWGSKKYSEVKYAGTLCRGLLDLCPPISPFPSVIWAYELKVFQHSVSAKLLFVRVQDPYACVCVCVCACKVVKASTLFLPFLLSVHFLEFNFLHKVVRSRELRFGQG